MFKKLQFSLLFFLFLFSFSIHGQTIGISLIQGEPDFPICLGKKVYIHYTKSGSFNNDNVFIVQVKSNYSNSPNDWVNLTAKDSSGILIAVLPNNIINVSSENNYTDFRIVSSSPNVVSTIGSSGVLTPAFVELLGIGKNTVYPYEIVPIKTTYTGTVPINIIYNDSSSAQIEYYNTNKNLVTAASKTGKFFIQKVSNACGFGKSSGSVDIKVIDNSLKIINVSKYDVCKKRDFSINIIKSGKWATDIKYKIRLTDSFYSDKSYDIESIGNDTIFTSTIDENIPNAIYKIKLIASNGVESDYFRNTLTVRYESKAEIVTPSTTIRYGEKQLLKVLVTGYTSSYAPSYFVELSDGQNIKKIEVWEGANTTQFIVSPKESTRYFIKSYIAACGNSTGNNVVLINVIKGIKTDSLKTGKYCEGTNAELYFSSNEKIPIGTELKVRLTTAYGGDRDVKAFVIKENVASFTIPTNAYQNFGNNNIYATLFSDAMPSTSMSSNYINVATFPTANIDNDYNSQTINIKSPKTVTIPIKLYGGGTYDVIFSSDTTKYKFQDYNQAATSYPAQLYVSKTSTISVKSIANVCGVNNVGSALSKFVTVDNPDYFIHLSSSSGNGVEVCAGNKIDLRLVTGGKFETGNQFMLELIPTDNTSNKSIGVLSEGPSKVTIPEDIKTGYYYLRISSNKPLLYSNTVMVFVRTLPTASLTGYNNDNLFIGLNADFKVSLGGGGPATVTYSDGTRNIYEYSYSQYTESFTKQFDQTTNFGITSVKNVCGLGTVFTKDILVGVKTYSINNLLAINSYKGNYYCLTSKFIVPFETTGLVKNNITFEVQFRKANDIDTTFKTLASNLKANYALVSIPDNYKTGNYNIRIVSSDGLVKSDIATITFITAPNLSLRLPDGSTQMDIIAGSSVTLRSNSQELSIYENLLKYVILDDKNIKTFGNTNDGYISVSKQPIENTNYTLVAAVNECGIGKGTGTVKITVKPIVNMNFKNLAYGNICVGASKTVVLNSLGGFERDNIFKVYAIDDNKVKINLLSITKNGEYTLTFGNNFKKGAYKIAIESSNPSLYKELQTVYLTTLPDISIAGAAIINYGSDAYLDIINNNVYKPKNGETFMDQINYELSDGTKGLTDLYNLYSSSSLRVFPLTTQTYSIKSVSNVCGIGKASGSATITVNKPSAKQVILFNNFSGFCLGSTISVDFSTFGDFSPNNKFTVQLSDISGKNFKNLETSGNGSPIKAKIPTDLTIGKGYYLRVLASDADATSNTNSLSLTAYEGITARFDTSAYYFSSDKPVNFKVRFTGTPPFTFNMGSDEQNAKYYYSGSNDYTFTINAMANASYKLFSVSSSTCSSGLILGPSTVRLELITALAELGKLGINIFPNPTADKVNIESNDKEIKIVLLDVLGNIIKEETLREEMKSVNLSDLSSGTYFLHVFKESKEAVVKIIKL